jgi:ankyrin repeat protein
MNEVTQALENDSIAKLKSLVKEGVDITKPIIIGEEYDLEEYDETSPLFYAIRKYASLELIEYLLEQGADLFERDDDGISALDIAIKFKRKDIIKYCLDKGFELNTTTRKSGITPVMLAACFSDIEMMKLLVESGADLNMADKSGMAPKDYAQKLGQKKMVEYLNECGAKFNLYPEENA